MITVHKMFKDGLFEAYKIRLALNVGSYHMEMACRYLEIPGKVPSPILIY